MMKSSTSMIALYEADKPGKENTATIASSSRTIDMDVLKRVAKEDTRKQNDLSYGPLIDTRRCTMRSDYIFSYPSHQFAAVQMIACKAPHESHRPSQSCHQPLKCFQTVDMSLLYMFLRTLNMHTHGLRASLQGLQTKAGGASRRPERSCRGCRTCVL